MLTVLRVVDFPVGKQATVVDPGIVLFQLDDVDHLPAVPPPVHVSVHDGGDPVRGFTAAAARPPRATDLIPALPPPAPAVPTAVVASMA